MTGSITYNMNVIISPVMRKSILLKIIFLYIPYVYKYIIYIFIHRDKVTHVIYRLLNNTRVRKL